jgi:hypothetical protein
MNSRRAHRLSLAAVLLSILTACAITDPEGDDLAITGEVPATREAVFQKAEAWLQERSYEIYARTSPDLLSARKALPGQDRRGRIEFTTSVGTASTTKYQVQAWTEVLGIQARENDAEMGADAQSLSAALNCPAARWPTCP